MDDSILIHGSLAFDLFFEYPASISDHLKSDTGSLYVNIRAFGPEKFFGGCAGNVAYTISLFGITPGVSSWLGTDGVNYLEHLQAAGTDISQIHINRNAATPSAVILSDSSDDQWIIFGEPRKPVNWKLPDLNGVGLAVITSGMPDRTRRLIADIAKRNIQLIMDPGKMIADICKDDLLFYIDSTDYLILNKYELNLCAEKTAVPVPEILTRAGAAVITEGKGGAAIYREGTETVRIPAAPVQTLIDPYGAGDAFLGGFSSALYTGGNLVDAVKTGTVAAAYAIESPGSQNHTFTPDEFQNRYAGVYNETLEEK